jgi:hypothetical protein
MNLVLLRLPLPILLRLLFCLFGTTQPPIFRPCSVSLTQAVALLGCVIRPSWPLLQGNTWQRKKKSKRTCPVRNSNPGFQYFGGPRSRDIGIGYRNITSVLSYPVTCPTSFFYRAIEKSRNLFLTHVIFVKKQITLKSENKKQCYIKCWKCPPRSAMRAFILFHMFDATRWRVSAVTVNGSPDEILSICLAQENREMYP